MFKIEKDMQVKLSNNLSKSIKQYGGSGAKRSIEGTYQQVCSNFIDSITIRINSGKYIGTWTILKSDLIDPTSKPVKVEPELFNPENLI